VRFTKRAIRSIDTPTTRCSSGGRTAGPYPTCRLPRTARRSCAGSPRGTRRAGIVPPRTDGLPELGRGTPRCGLGDRRPASARHRAVADLPVDAKRQVWSASAAAVSFPGTTGRISKSMRSDH
jgi:hypothetical protein